MYNYGKIFYYLLIIHERNRKLISVNKTICKYNFSFFMRASFFFNYMIFLNLHYNYMNCISLLHRNLYIVIYYYLHNILIYTIYVICKSIRSMRYIACKIDIYTDFYIQNVYQNPIFFCTKIYNIDQLIYYLHFIYIYIL